MKKLALILLAVLALYEGQLGYTAIAKSLHSTQSNDGKTVNKAHLPSVDSLLQRKMIVTDSVSQPKQQNQFGTNESKATQNMWGEVHWQFDESTGVLRFTGKGSLGDWNTSPWNRRDSYKISATAIKKIIFTQPVIAPKDSSYLFSGLQLDSRLRNLVTIEGLTNLDTSQVTTMFWMFVDDSSLESLNLNGFNTSNVTNFSNMFGGCTNLSTLNLNSFDTSKVTNMSTMFGSVSNLNHLTLGPKTKLNRNVDLPAIPRHDSYTGNWVNQADSSINMGTSDQFMTAYNGTHPGTYIWEIGKVNIQSIEPISFGIQTIKENNSATTHSNITIKDTLPQTANQHWELMVRYDSTDAQTKQWLAAQLKLSFSPHSDQPFLNLPTTLTVGEENQQIAELPDESKKETQVNQSIALNPQLQAPGKVLVGTHRAQLIWDLEATPTT